MPDRIAIVSIIGRGRRVDASRRTGYAPTTYEFLHDGQRRCHPGSLFAAALLRHLTVDRGKPVGQIVAVGTPGSQWGELRSLLADPEMTADHQLQDTFLSIDDRGHAGLITDSEACFWTERLTAVCGVRISPIVTSACLQPTEQRELVSRLSAGLSEGDHVVMDVSHGYRHLPIVLMHGLQTLQRLGKISSIEYVSGVHEARDPDTDVTPAVGLAVCTELAGLAEDVAIYQSTGNYGPLGERLGIPQSREAWYLESTSQLMHARSVAKGIRQAIDSGQFQADGLGQDAAKVLRAATSWSTGTGLADRFVLLAERSLDRDDFLRAAVLACEAAKLVAYREVGGERSRHGRSEREEGAQAIRAHRSRISARCFRRAIEIRNAVAHGTLPTGSGTFTDGPGQLRQRLQDLITATKEAADAIR